MLTFFKEYKRFGLGLLLLSAVIVTIFYFILKPKEELTTLQPADINYELVDTDIQHVKKYHKIGDFKLVNQNGDTITQQDYRDKIYVADFFFTTCQTICPVMTDHMLEIQEKLKNDSEVLLLSHTVTPEIDDVETLNKYAEEKGVDDEKWNLVTGDRKQIYDLARKSYLVVKDDGTENYGMIHTENFVLVDKNMQIKGMYDGTNPDEIEKLLHDIKVLKKE